MHNYYYGTKNSAEMIKFHFETYFIYLSKFSIYIIITQYIYIDTMQ